ncbi:MAG: single-stranded DNA-binding protein [Clostridiales bacterium]|nr:single-stranded DNA-binding protein [Clostridiales bacterium]
MTDKIFDTNQVSVAGEVMNNFLFSHEVFGEGFYLIDVYVPRLSKTYDVIPVMVSDRIIDVKEDLTGKKIEVTGQFRSYNRHEENKNRLILSVFARELRILDEDEDLSKLKTNHIFLDGYVCKEPVYRKTPLGREISDLLIAVNRPYGKSDYIPCICWGRNARYAGSFEIGGHLHLYGRIQSREYQKKIGEDQYETRIAYEVSVNKLEYFGIDQ